MNLFQFGSFQLHGGQLSNWKIECDALTDEDWECLAELISWKVKFGHVHGIPRGGLKLAQYLKKYETWRDPPLYVDDVYTTGRSMASYLQNPTDMGFVVFARTKPLDSRIKVLFQYNE